MSTSSVSLARPGRGDWSDLHALLPPSQHRAGRVLAPADAEFLRERLDWARRFFDNLPFALDPGVIHGTANVGNACSTTTARPS